jgi:hypothetical protein
MRRLAPWWATLLFLVGLGLLAGTAMHGASAYFAIVSMDSAAHINTPNPLFLFSDITSTGIKLNNQIDPRNRGAYSDALTQFVLDGTGVCIGLVFMAAGLFVRLNE